MGFLSSYWVKSGLFTISQRVFTIGFGLLGFMLLVRMLSREEFGIWSLFLVIVSMVEITKLGFLKNAHIKFINSEETIQKPFINTASFSLNVGISIVLAIGLCIFGMYISPLFFDPELSGMLIFYGMSSVLLSPFYQLQFTQSAEFDFRATFIATMVRQGLFAITILVVFLFELHISLFYLAVLQFAVVVPATVVSWLLSKKHMIFSKVIEMQWVVKFAHYGKFTAGTNISNIVFKSLDQLLIGALINSASVALYNNAIRISNLVEVPALSLTEIMFPKSVQSHQTEGTAKVRTMYEKSVASILCFIMPFTAFVIIFPEPLIIILSGRQYLDVVPIVRVTMLYSLIVPFTLQFGTVMDSIGYPRINFILITLTALLAGVLIYLALPVYGSIGAAYATLTAYLFNMVVGQMLLSKYVGVKFINVFKYIPEMYAMAIGIAKGIISSGNKKDNGN